MKTDTEVPSGDEGGDGRKKRRTKAKKEANGNGEPTHTDEARAPPDEEEAVFSGPEDEKPKKVRNSTIVMCNAQCVQRIPKKRVVRDDDEEEGMAGPRKKQMFVVSSIFKARA